MTKLIRESACAFRASLIAQLLSSAAGLEANLDIQYTVGMAGGVPVTFFSVGDDIMDGVAGFMVCSPLILRQAFNHPFHT